MSIGASAVRHYKQGDRLPVYEAVLLLGGVEPMPLTDATGVEFWMRNIETGVLKIHAAGAIVAPDTDGRVQYAWGATDLNIPGEYTVEWKVQYTGGRVLTAPSGDLDVVIVDADPSA